MSTLTEFRPSPALEAAVPLAPTAIPERRRLTPAALMAAGGGVLLAAALLGASLLRATPALVGPAAEAPAPATTVGITDATYPPGHSSGWHTHPGVHSVVVLEGVLTIFDQACNGQDVGAGQSYIGGRDPHLVRNDSATPVRLVVTYAFDQVSALDHAATVPAPPGCASR
jgi:quercetin dioxygenase-like cupin family protein